MIIILQTVEAERQTKKTLIVYITDVIWSSEYLFRGSTCAPVDEKQSVFK